MSTTNFHHGGAESTEIMSLRVFEWDKASSDERDAACAQFMPPSEVNPMRCWYLQGREGKKSGPLRVRSKAEAEEWLSYVRKTAARWDEYTQFTQEHRKEATIYEHVYHVHYTDTPGGGWMLIDELVKRGCKTTVVTSLRGNQITVHIEIEKRMVILKHPSLPMEQLAGIAWLMWNGIKVTTSDSSLKIATVGFPAEVEKPVRDACPPGPAPRIPTSSPSVLSVPSVVNQHQS